MMILIWIIIINQQKSPQNRHFIFTSNKPLNIRKLDWRNGKRNHSDCNNPFPQPLLLHSFLLTLFSFVSPPPNNKQRKYVYVCKDIYANIRIYVCASNSTYTNMQTFKNTKNLGPYTHKQPPLFEQKTNRFSRAFLLWKPFTLWDNFVKHETSGHKRYHVRYI